MTVLLLWIAFLGFVLIGLGILADALELYAERRDARQRNRRIR